MSNFIDPYLFCLEASFLWLPAVIFACLRMQRANASAQYDRVWKTALVIAAAPLLIAPIATSLNWSLHPPVTVETTTAAIATPRETQTVTTTPQTKAAQPAPTHKLATPIISENPFATRRLSASLPGEISLERLKPAALAIYLYGFTLLLAIALLRSAAFAWRIKNEPVLNVPAIKRGLDDWAQKFGLRSMPTYKVTDTVTSVCVHGVMRPTILIPKAIVETTPHSDVMMMGAHEMAHIKRNDTVLFAVSSLLQAAFWFNPFIHVITSRVSLAAEKAADRLVIDNGVERHAYAKCFVNGLKTATNLEARLLTPALSFTPFDKKSRKERLSAILTGTATTQTTLAQKVTFTIVCIGALGLAAAQAAFAVAPRVLEQTPTTPPAPTPLAQVDATALAAAVPAPPPTPTVDDLDIVAANILTTTPLDGDITLSYGAAQPSSTRKTHTGVDIKSPRGVPVVAAGPGKVVTVTSRLNGNSGYGKVVAIDHGHGLVTRYAHLDSFLVSEGTNVNGGDVIGTVGSTGRSTGPHLHFEVLKNNASIDPANYGLYGTKSAALETPDTPQPRQRIAALSTNGETPIDNRHNTVNVTRHSNSEGAETHAEVLLQFDGVTIDTPSGIRDIQDPKFIESLKALEGLDSLAALEGLQDLADLKELEVLSQLGDIDPDDINASQQFFTPEDLQRLRETQRDAMAKIGKEIEKQRQIIIRATQFTDAERDALEKAAEHQYRFQYDNQEFLTREEVLKIEEDALVEARQELEKRIGEVRRERRDAKREAAIKQREATRAQREAERERRKSE